MIWHFNHNCHFKEKKNKKKKRYSLQGGLGRASIMCRNTFGKFLLDEFKPMTPRSGPPDTGIDLPPQPVLSLLAWGQGKCKDSLRTPDKILKTWYDGNFKDDFRAFLEESRQNFALDVKPSDVTEEDNPAAKRRKVATASWLSWRGDGVHAG